MGNKKFSAEDFKAWLSEHDITIAELNRTLKMPSASLLYKYFNNKAAIPDRFKFTLDGVLVDRINKAKKGLDRG